MDRLWATWRMQYIESADDQPGCIFCNFPAEHQDEKRLIVHRSSHCFIILNAYPYSNGHLMVTPFRHTSTWDDFTPDELLDLMTQTRFAVNMLKAAFKPDGFNIGVNMGRVAGAGIADHLHMHVVPRWSGDTNFMPVLGDTRVIPESLKVVYRRLVDALPAVQTFQDDAPCPTV